MAKAYKICIELTQNMDIQVKWARIALLVLSHSQVRLFAAWAVTHQAPLSTGILQARTLEWVALPILGGHDQYLYFDQSEKEYFK